jgi:predicted transcriptional regulator
MPTQTRSRSKPPADGIYRSTAAAPKQREFPHRRRSVKTYGRRKPAKDPNQETLTQMNFTSSAMQHYTDPPSDEEEGGQDDEVEEIKQPKPTRKVKSTTKTRGNRRKTAGDESFVELQQPPPSKRRKTLGDSPNPGVSSSFHTQTLTQMLSGPKDEEDVWQIKDSEDEDDLELVVRTPSKKSAKHPANELVGGTESTIPSLVKSATPAGRQIRTEVPSSQSPATPMLLRYSPVPHSPLITRSTNVSAPSPILKEPLRRTRSTVIPDSYSTTHDAPTPTPKSTIKATPSKRLRFELPEDKENITPGRTKPKSPKPKSQTTGRRPLQEVPDSDEELDEDLDETEYETETEDDGANDPGTPTPKRLKSVPPPFMNPEPENDSIEPVHSPLQDGTDLAIWTETRESRQELGRDPRSKASPVPEPEARGSPGLPSGGSAENSPSHRPGGHRSLRDKSEVEQNGGEDTETQGPARVKQAMIDSAPASIIERTPTPEPSVADEAGNDGSMGDTSISTQDYMYTQGLESQRLSLDAIRSTGPQTPHSDIMVSLHPEHIAKIIDRSKNHEFRAWKIPPQVSRIWIYITKPESQLKYMCIFGEPKAPGEVQDEKGVGNVEFNRGMKAAKFAYEILEVYELNNPVLLEEMKTKGWVNGAPQKYTYILPAVVGELTANLRCALFGGHTQRESSPKAGVSESQELRAQLQSDADYSTQHYSDALEEVVPASQSPLENRTKSKRTSDKRDFAKPALPRAPSRAPSVQDQDSPKLPSQRRGSALMRPSQATTVSHVSSSPAISPQKSGGRADPQTIFISSQSSPAALRRDNSSIRSSQFPSRSQLLPDSLLNDDIHEPPPIVYDSADEDSS